MARLLVIADGSVLVEPLLTEVQSIAGSEYEVTARNSLRCEDLHDPTIDLLIPLIAPNPKVAEFLGWFQDQSVSTPMLAIIPTGLPGELLSLASRVADDFILAPIRREELSYRVNRILGLRKNSYLDIHESLTNEFGLAQLVGRDPSFLKMIEKIPLVARSRSPVLITGETGTGKELCAHAIHHLSPYRDHPFIPIDCAALPDNLFESEMFGHSRGAFTDAHRDQKGLVALAEGGTLFLDEVDSLPLGAQAKLLRFLQEHTYRPLGSDRFINARIHVLAATNRDLEAVVRAKQFRADLFFRLSVIQFPMIPLRERLGDIAILAHYFLDSICSQEGIGRKILAPSTVRVLTDYDWPGNIRELRNVINRAVVFSEGTQILPHHILGVCKSTSDGETRMAFHEARAHALQTFERRYVADILRECGGNVTRAARLAQKDRRVFGRLVKRYNIRAELPSNVGSSERSM